VGPTGSQAVYIVDLVICMHAHVVVTMFILSGPNAAMVSDIKLKYVVVISRTVVFRSSSCGIKGKVKTSSDRAIRHDAQSRG